MTVCDVCWTPSTYTSRGRALFHVLDTAKNEYQPLFHTAENDFCETCLRLFQQKNFAELGKRAHEAVLTRAGLPEEVLHAS